MGLYTMWHAMGLAAMLVAWPAHHGARQVSDSATWNRHAGQTVPSSPLLGTVRVGQNPVALVVAAGAGRVFAVNGGVRVNDAGALIAPGSASMLDATTGTVVRTVALDRGPKAIAVDERTGRVFVAALTTVSMLDARTGAVLRTITPNKGPRGLAVDDAHGQVFVTTQGAPGTDFTKPGPASIAVLDATTGAIRRTLPVDGYKVAVDGLAGRVFVQAVGCSGAYAATACVDTIDAGTDRQLGVTFLPNFKDPVGTDPTYFALAVDTRVGRAIAQFGDGRGGSYVGVVDALTGKLVRGQPLDGGGGSVGVITVDEQTGRAFVVTTAAAYEAAQGASNAVVSVLDTRSSRVLTNVTVTSATSGSIYPAGVTVDTRRCRVYVVTTPYTPGDTQPLSTLSVLNGRTGQVLRTVVLAHVAAPVGIFAGPAMAVDERTGRLFIANGSNNTVSVFDTARL